MPSPLVSIGITCFNARDTVARAIRSALAQDWPNLEIVIVDDCSTDGSREVILATIAKEKRARLIARTSNGGPGAARNTVVSAAQGEFVAFFDDDDESLPGRISRQVETLTAYESVFGSGLVACYASGIRRYPNGYTVALPAIGSRGKTVPHGTAVADYLLTFRLQPDYFYGSGTPACSLLTRRSTIEAVGGFDPELRRVEDADFAVRLALLGGHFVGTAEALFVQYATAAPDKSPERNLEAQQRLVSKHRDYLEKIGRFDYARRWQKLRYCHFSRRYGQFARELFGLFVRYPRTVTLHLLSTGPRRLLHESRMRGKRQADDGVG
ncbi:MAG: glycosyltransferase family 2 protein [Methyloceanibacter sp.]